jgi:hypothetical protein
MSRRIWDILNYVMCVRQPLFLVGLVASTMMSCSSSFEPREGMTFVLSDVAGRTPPTAFAASVPRDTLYAAALAANLNLLTDSTGTYSEWDGQAHRQQDGSISYTCQNFQVNYPVAYKLAGDTLFLFYRGGIPVVSPPPFFLVQGSVLTEQFIGWDDHFKQGTPTTPAC